MRALASRGVPGLSLLLFAFACGDDLGVSTGGAGGQTGGHGGVSTSDGGAPTGPGGGGRGPVGGAPTGGRAAEGGNAGSEQGGSGGTSQGGNGGTNADGGNGGAPQGGTGGTSQGGDGGTSQGGNGGDQGGGGGSPMGCGDGVVDLGEECDDGPANSDTTPDACRTNCEAAFCGDSVPDTGEPCDDGNASNADTCLTTCVFATCGDGFLHLGFENCDDGNLSNSDDCLTSCVGATCGDGFVHAGFEACDDGNGVNGDGCETTCVVTTQTDLVLQSFITEYHDQDLVYRVTARNQGGSTATNVKVDFYHNVTAAPPVGAAGQRRVVIPSLAPGASVSVSALFAIAQDPFDAQGTVRNDWARIDPLGEIAESNENNNLAGPNDGAVLRDFCAPCTSDSQCDFSECLLVDPTDEGYCGSECITDIDCNVDSSCVPVSGLGTRCVPDLGTCHANCDPGAEIIDIAMASFVDNGNGTFTATLTGSTAGNPNLTGPTAAADCAVTDGAAGEAFFVLHLAEGAFPTGLLGAATTANLTIDTETTSGFGSNNDTVVYVRKECMDVRPSAQLGCDDDGATNPNFGSRLVLNNVAKGSYVIVLDGFNAAAEGPFVLHVTVDPN